MKDLSFIPFGSQYYRAPTPLAESWEADLTAIKNYGFNTVKLWVQWRRNMPKENLFDFGDIDALMAICERLGLKAVLNIICDVASAWFYKKYPDSLMITADGRKLYPQTVSCRQIGGAPGPCLHHKAGTDIRRSFIEAAALRYRDHPALLCWDLWNEPELTCGIAREPELKNMVCYCDESVNEFRKWLKSRFSLEELNARWGRNYGEWDEVEPPRSTGTFADMVDWREFFGLTLAAENAMRAEAVRRFDDTHPVMVHTVPLPHFNFMNTGSDEYLLARDTDWFGNSIGSEAFPAVVTTSAAPGKRVINSEIHACGGDIMSHPGTLGLEEVKSHIFRPLGRGIKGFLFWQYRPERLGKESPAWGLVNMDGGETESVKNAAKINDALQKNAQKLLSAFPKSAKIAVLNSTSSQTFLWEISGGTDLHYRSVFGAFKALYDAQYNVDIISDHRLKAERLAGYEVLYFPAPYFIDQKTADVLREFVFSGGTLISECLFGGVSGETGLYSTVMPGFGFDEVFGCKQISSATAASFVSAYGADYSKSEENRSAVFFTDTNGNTARGYYFREDYEPLSAKVIARYDAEGIKGAAATVNDFGKGRAVIIGTLPAYMAGMYDCADSKAFIARLIKDIANIYPESKTCGVLRADTLYNGKEPTAVVLQLGAARERRVVFSDPAMQNKTLKNILTGKTLSTDSRGECIIPETEALTELYLVETS